MYLPCKRKNKINDVNEIMKTTTQNKKFTTKVICDSVIYTIK